MIPSRKRISGPLRWSRVRTQLTHQVSRAAKRMVEKKDIGSLVIAGCDAPEILEATEHALDDIASLVGDFVIAMRMFAGGVWRDDNLDPPPGEHLPQTPSVIGAIGEKPLGLMSHRQQAARSLEIVDVSGRDQQGMRAADLIGQRADFGRLPTARATNSVVEGPPFAPAAERWALM